MATPGKGEITAQELEVSHSVFALPTVIHFSTAACDACMRTDCADAFRADDQ